MPKWDSRKPKARIARANKARIAKCFRVMRFIWEQCGADATGSQKKIKNIFRKGENVGIPWENALVFNLSSARLSARQAVCTFPTDEIDR